MARKLWGGRFKKKTDPLVEEFTKSIDYDYRLAGFDVIGTIIHVTILEKSGFLSSNETKKLVNSLQKIYKQISKGTFRFDRRAEDVHTNIQNAVEKDVGELALKMHTARSRNDQVLFDVKLFCKFALETVANLCRELQNSLKKASQSVKELVIPGYTHLQHAHLVYLSDYLLSYVEMLKRDIERLENAKNGIELNMGAGALAGTPIDSKFYNKALRDIIEDMKGLKIVPTKNSIDTVSDRDFVLEILSGMAILGMHLSRLSEDLIIWSTKEFGFLELDDTFATGSSLMPQKKNPDVLELIRGYTGTLYGNLVSVLTMMKGLPLTYNRDMQLDKEPLFGSLETVEKELKVLAKLVKRLKWNKKNIEKVIKEDETLYATDLLYYLVKKEIPFKKAHDIIGKLVKFSLNKNKKIKDMDDKELKQLSDKLKHKDIVKIMDPVVSVKSRISVDRSKLKT